MVAERQIRNALAGDNAAIIDIANRIDGRPPAQDEAQPIMVNFVIMAPPEQPGIDTWQHQHAPKLINGQSE
jgi:hypothetical protein